MTVESYLHRGRQLALHLASDQRLRRAVRLAAPAGAGFLLSAASLGNFPQPIAMALVSTLTGRYAAMAALGSAAGYRLFWGDVGALGGIWAMLGALTALVLSRFRLFRASVWTIPALCSLWAAASGLVWLLLGHPIPTLGYLLGVALAGGCGALFPRLREKREPVAQWLGMGVWVLALAQVAPVPWLGLGYIAAGALALGESFPPAALAGLALDLAGVTPVPMTAVTSLIWMTRLVPGLPKPVRRLTPGPVYLLVMSLGLWRDLNPLAGLILGGGLAVLLPGQPRLTHRRGEMGQAQVRLELVSGVLSQTRQMLMELPQSPIDEQALLARTRERACGSCPNRKSCPRLGEIPTQMLHIPWTENNSLPFPCRKPGRMILELRRTQEYYRKLRADREAQREYRRAVIQQYGFLSEYLQELSDGLGRREKRPIPRFQPEAAVAARSREEDNGDRCLHFRGPEGRFFLLLCDGMGTGLGAAREAADAARLLEQLLTAGFPAEHALQSLNSFLSLGRRAGAVTADLAEIELDTGRVRLYKWGAAPSYLLRGGVAERIGTAGPPPGMGVHHSRMDVQRLSLRRGETLIMASDGVDGEEMRRCAVIAPGLAAGEMAAKLLEVGAEEACDDATVAVVRLQPSQLST